MYVCLGTDNNTCAILDSRDGKIEIIDNTDIIKTRVPICGIAVENGVVKTVCTTKDALGEFFYKVKGKLAKLKFLEVQDRQRELIEVGNLALKYGFITDMSQLSVSVQDRTLLFTSIGKIITWEDSDSYEMVEECDIRSKDCAKLSKLGYKAFEYMYLTIGSEKVYMVDLIKEFAQCARANFEHSKIMYIGITQGNNMFKICTTFGLYSVKFDTLENAEKQRDKILNAKVTSLNGFKDYFRHRLYYNNGRNFVVTKATRKEMSYKEVLNKYKTIHTVYSFEGEIYGS